MKLDATLKEIRLVLHDSIDERLKTSQKKYFKEEIRSYGISMGTVGKIGKLFFNSIKHHSKQNIFDICEELWKPGYMEEAMIACNTNTITPQYL